MVFPGEKVLILSEMATTPQSEALRMADGELRVGLFLMVCSTYRTGRSGEIRQTGAVYWVSRPTLRNGFDAREDLSGHELIRFYRVAETDQAT